MKIAMLYNESAGEGLSLTTLRRVLERHGHELAHVVEKDSEFGRVFDRSTELVVAAGGDGTVGRAANALIGRTIPLAILPAGTANNVASSLGIEGHIDDVIASWATAHRRPFDIGILRWASSEYHVVEGLGAGLVPAGITAVKASRAESRARSTHDSDDADASAKLVRALRTYQEILSRLIPRPCTLRLDGTRLEGAFLLIEVLNIRSVGPNLVLSPGADPSDGAFDVVTAEAEHRAQLSAYLQHRIDGKDDIRLRLPTRRAQEVEIEGIEEMHVDDEVCRSSSPDLASVRIERAALEVLSPTPSPRGDWPQHAPQHR